MTVRSPTAHKTTAQRAADDDAWVFVDEEHRRLAREEPPRSWSHARRQLHDDMRSLPALLLILPGMAFFAVAIWLGYPEPAFIGLMLHGLYAALFVSDTYRKLFTEVRTVYLRGPTREHSLPGGVACTATLEPSAEEIKVAGAGLGLAGLLERHRRVRGLIMYTPNAEFSLVVAVRPPDD